MANTWRGRGTGGPRSSGVNATASPLAVSAQLRKAAQSSNAVCGSGPNLPALAVATSRAPSAVRTASLPRTLAIRMVPPSAAARPQFEDQLELAEGGGQVGGQVRGADPGLGFEQEQGVLGGLLGRGVPALGGARLCGADGGVGVVGRTDGQGVVGGYTRRGGVAGGPGRG